MTRPNAPRRRLRARASTAGARRAAPRPRRPAPPASRRARSRAAAAPRRSGGCGRRSGARRARAPGARGRRRSRRPSRPGASSGCQGRSSRHAVWRRSGTGTGALRRTTLLPLVGPSDWQWRGSVYGLVPQHARGASGEHAVGVHTETPHLGGIRPGRRRARGRVRHGRVALRRRTRACGGEREGREGKDAEWSHRRSSRAAGRRRMPPLLADRKPERWARHASAHAPYPESPSRGAAAVIATRTAPSPRGSTA